jgi:O-antigen ligase
MLSGLFAGPVLAVLFPVMFIRNYKKLDFSRIKQNRLEIILLSWLFLSCIWSLNGVYAFTKYITAASVAIGFMILSDTNLLEEKKLNKFFRPLFIGAFVAVILFAIEYKTQGYISLSFRKIFQKSDRQYFTLYFLDRGCSVLSMISWPIFYVLLKRKKFFMTIIYFIIVAYVLRISDSLASFLAFILGFATFFTIFLTRAFLIYGIVLTIISASIFMPVFSYYQSPRDISSVNAIPDSGKHRLFIWKFTATKAMEKPIFGWGFNSSPVIPVDEEDDIVYFNQYKWHPLPLHPHNIFMQIWLECGAIGLVLLSMVFIKTIFRIYNNHKRNKDLIWTSTVCACFMNYLFISMISYGMWQMWWISTTSIVSLLFIIFQHYILPSKNRENLSI